MGAIVASTNMRLAESFGAAELVGFDGSSDDVFAEMVAAVESGAIDAMVDDEPAFGAQLASGEFRIAHVAETQNAWGAACRLGDDETVALLDDGIGRAVASGALADVWRAGSAPSRCRRHRRLTVGTYPPACRAARALCPNTRGPRPVARPARLPRVFIVGV